MIMGDTSNFTESLVVLQIYDNTMQAEIAKSMLESAGIFCVLHGEYISSIYSTGAFPVRLMVKPEDVDVATGILNGR